MGSEICKKKTIFETRCFDEQVDLVFYFRCFVDVLSVIGLDLYRSAYVMYNGMCVSHFFCVLSVYTARYVIALCLFEDSVMSRG